MMAQLKEWFSYPSTWKGIITALGLVGVTFAPDQSEAITTAGIALVAAIWTFFSDSDVKKG